MKLKINFPICLFLFCVPIAYGCKKDLTKDYVSKEKAILFYSVAGQTQPTKIQRTLDSSVVQVTLADTMNLTSVVPLITVSRDATIEPASGMAVDFSRGNHEVQYVVKAPDGSTRNWLVRASVAAVDSFAHLVFVPNTGGWVQTADVYKDTMYDNYLTRDTGWNGGDGCYSLLLADNAVLWTFQDSFLGDIDPGRNRPSSNKFARNAGFIEKDMSTDNLTLLNKGGGGAPFETWIQYDNDPENDTKELYWPGDAQVHNNQVQILLSHLKYYKDQAGNDSLGHEGTDVGVFSLPDMQLDGIVKDKFTGDINFDAGLFAGEDRYTYLYAGGTSGVQVARAPGNDLLEDWQFLTASGWADQPDGYKMEGIEGASIPNVIFDGKYYMVTQSPYFFGHEVYIYESATPVGPWYNKRTIYTVPPLDNVITYNASLHQELSRHGELVLSYNINPTDFFGGNFGSPGTADNYRPHFVRIFHWK